MHRSAKEFSFDTMDITELDVPEELSGTVEVDALEGLGIDPKDADWAALTY